MENVFLEYNCYAYALFYNTSPTDSYFTPFPGYFSDPESFDILGPIEDWVPLTVSDLKNEGYSCVVETTSYPEIMEFKNTHDIICLRKGNHPDFHFMRFDTNSWYHKPGNTHILRYLYYRPDLHDWIAEYSFEGVDYPPRSDQAYYTGTICYFAFSTEHSFLEPTYTGVHNHLGVRHLYKFCTVCEHCGEAEYSWVSVSCDGPPCMLAYILSMPDEHVTQ